MSVIRQFYAPGDDEALMDAIITGAEGNVVTGEVRCLVCADVIPNASRANPVVCWRAGDGYLYFHPNCVPHFFGIAQDAEEVRAINDVNTRHQSLSRAYNAHTRWSAQLAAHGQVSRRNPFAFDDAKESQP